MNIFLYRIWTLSNSQKSSPTPVYLNYGTNDILNWISLCSGNCPVHGGMFTCVHDIYPLDASRTLTVVVTKIVCRH